jgi:hypothetical protein
MIAPEIIVAHAWASKGVRLPDARRRRTGAVLVEQDIDDFRTPHSAASLHKLASFSHNSGASNAPQPAAVMPEAKLKHARRRSNRVESPSTMGPTGSS